ncbi:MAG: T9SS type A sorting domain-containing protein, partial [Cyclobacteriaceae bacterium]
LAGNRITSIPDFSSLANLASVDVSGNRLEFDDLEPNMDLSGTIVYAAQRLVGISTADTVKTGLDVVLEIAVGGSENIYTWKRSDDLGKDTTVVANATRSNTYTVEAVDFDNMGDYLVEVTSELVSNLTLTTRVKKVRATANLIFTAVGDGNKLLDSGTGYALRFTRPGVPFDSAATITPTGEEFQFNDLVLGDYLIAIEGDREVFLPTYYANTFLWEEADTLELRDDFFNQLRMTKVPGVRPPLPEGGIVKGEIAADFKNENGNNGNGNGNGRVSARRKVKKAGCSMRRFVRSGRMDEEGEFVLYAYVESDDEGRFNFTDIEPGLYRFNIEYPGIPMDPDSFVEFEIGADGKEKNSFSLEATITEDGIAVEKIEELGFFRKYFKDLSVYPNPSDKDMHITYAKMLAKGVVMRLVDLSGQTMYEQVVTPGYNGEISIDVRDVPSGVYLLNFVDTIEGVGTVVTYKVFVKH